MVLGDGRCIAPLSRSTCWERPWPYIRRLAHVCTFMFWVIESVYGMYESFFKKIISPLHPIYWKSSSRSWWHGMRQLVLDTWFLSFAVHPLNRPFHYALWIGGDCVFVLSSQNILQFALNETSLSPRDYCLPYSSLHWRAFIGPNPKDLGPRPFVICLLLVWLPKIVH